jgi:hypothetical protein
LRARVETQPRVERQGPVSAPIMMQAGAAPARRKSRAR